MDVLALRWVATGGILPDLRKCGDGKGVDRYLDQGIFGGYNISTLDCA